MATDKSRLEAANARYEEWSAQTASTRETAGKAKAELQRRGHSPSPAETPESRSTPEWRRESKAHGDVADRVLTWQQQAAVKAGHQWPPVRHPQAQPEAEHVSQPRISTPEQPEIPEPEPDRHGEPAARPDELQARSDDAAARIEAQRAELDASKEYNARMEREAQAEPEADWQAEASDEVEMELQ